MIFAYNGFPDILVRAESRAEATRLIAEEVSKYSDDVPEDDEIEEIPAGGPSKVLRVNTA